MIEELRVLVGGSSAVDVVTRAIETIKTARKKRNEWQLVAEALRGQLDRFSGAEVNQ